MISLFLDTATTRLAVALYKKGKLLDLIEEENNNQLSERLLPVIDLLLTKNNLELSDLEEIIVVNGPGSFTGIRIGVTVAKTLAFSLHIPIKTISELSVLATTPVSTTYVCPYIDARRDAIYTGLYDQFLTSMVEDQYSDIEDWRKHLNSKTCMDHITWVGNGIEKSISPKVDYQRLSNLFRFLDIINPHLVNPNYLKKTEAEEKLSGSH